MKLKSAIKYQLSQSKKSIIILYSIIFLIICLSLTLSKIFPNDQTRLSGIESSSIVFIFISGLVLFRSSVKMFIQNGISRITLFKSYIYTFIAIVIIMAIMDSLNMILLPKLMDYQSIFKELYGQKYLGNSSNISMIVEGFFWSITVYYLFAMLGFFTTLLYFRMNRWQKLIVSIVIPATIFIILPVLSSLNQPFVENFFSFLALILGLKDGYFPSYAMITNTLLSIIFMLLSYLLIRNAPMKDN